MAVERPPALLTQLAGLTRLPAHRQFGLVIGLAVVAALAVTVALWAMKPSYQLLLPDMAERDIAEAIDILAPTDIAYRLDRRGALTVPANRVHEARLTLATQGLPRAQGVGFELLDQGSGLGTSQLVEMARYQRAIEGELARSIVTLDGVERARVHLAIPRPSAFVRDRVKPTASVIVSLHPGRQIDDAQVAGIVHMVASSVPELEAGRVAVVDQRGRLLSETGGTGTSGGATRQLDYTHRVEDAYRQRVEDILAPLVGADGMRVQVTAEVDFTEIESTRETFDSENPVMRSEQLHDEESAGAASGGVPGALTNQPPGGAVVAIQAGVAEAEAELGQSSAPVNRTRSSTRNYEVDRTIDHIRQAPATLNHVSVAVVVDHREVVDESGARTRVPREPEEMEHLTALVREAVGLDEGRGDRLNVVNASFQAIEELPPQSPDPLWMQPWAWELARYAAGGLGFLLLIFVVIRPVLKSLAQVPLRPATVLLGPVAAMNVGGRSSIAPTEEQMTRARKTATDDPRLAAQVVRRWVSDDGK